MTPDIKAVIERLNQTGEVSTVEAKRGTEIGASLFESISAFSNEPHLDGGTILLGVEKDTNGLFPFYRVVGIDNAEKMQDDLSSQCASVFNTIIRPRMHVQQVDGKNVLAVRIPEAQPSDKPVYILNKSLPKGAYRRIGSTDVRCTDEDLQLLYEGRAQKSFDQQILDGATADDIDPEAIALYRQLRAKASPAAEELSWNDRDLLFALKCLDKNPKGGEHLPTVAGIMVFGKPQALRRLLPMIRVDYIRVPGTAWISDPDNRYTSLELRDCLIRLVRRAEAAITDDLPKAFHLPEGELQRKDLPVIPARVIREALVNALIHRSYRDQQPIQIIRYANRLEIRNPGYSLAAEDRLGEPGSYPRNPHIAAIFHELHFAETKGSGIRTMMALMEKSNLTPPAAYSDRVSNTFSMQLLFHHLLGEDDLVWLKEFRHLDLSDEQKKALIFVRETGAINNAIFRTITKQDTLTASKQLQEMVKNNLLESKAKGPATYYEPGKAFLPKLSATQLSTDLNRPQLGANRPQLDTNRPQLNDVPKNIVLKIQALGGKPKIQETMSVVFDLCVWRPLSAEEISKILGRDKKRLKRNMLTPMIEQGRLSYTMPDMPNHPKQQYKPNSGKS